MNRFWKSIRQTLHAHSWIDTAWNGYYVAAERRCRCGERQHVDLTADLAQPFGSPSVWLPGPHPIAQTMRTAKDQS